MRLRRLVLGWLMLAVSVTAASAEGLVRDAEIESTLTRIANPIFRAAGLNPASVHIYIVNDRDLNAFVAGGQNIFLFTGLLARLETIDQLRAVIAHETGHIAGGHQARRDQAMKGARGMALIGMVGAAAATMGGSPTAGLAIASSTRQAAERSLLAHSRAEEASADQAGLRYMAAAGSDPAAILEVLDLFRGQEALMPSRMDPYALTHPLWSERIALLEDKTAALPHGDGPDPQDVYWHGRMVAKITGFLGNASDLQRRYPAGDTSEEADLARSIAAHRRPNPARATALADALIAARPDDPFYHELKGQFLLESGNASGAVASYRDAVALAPKEALILAGLGRALLNIEDAASDAEARDVLMRSSTLDKANAGVYRDLALAEARLGDQGAAALATAERFVLEGRFADAERHAGRAVGLLPDGSPGWLQAQDVITVARRAQN